MLNLLPYAIAWSVLAVIVIVLAIARKSVSSHEDDSIHLSGGEASVSEQVVTAKKLDSIDRWGKILTVLLAVSGAALAIIYGLQLWESTSKVGLG
ncbi:MAG: hypothetical protein HY821_20260 [Acidobacteria bacterium]|nr:hypothetical protein [Acidobacteriota bacterium]